MQMESRVTSGNVILCLFSELALFQIRISPVPKFKIGSKENGIFIFVLQHFKFLFRGCLFKFAS